ncbi:MAG: SpoIIE family protein phosphatase [Bacteroidetes bacterium]|nr:SpoIIE family protein phosphatase [Bacteroidota bacterium]
MKNFIKLTHLFIAIFFTESTRAQNFLQDSLSTITHQHTPWQILSGSGEDSIVCYKSSHRNVYFLITALIIVIALIAIKLLLLNKKTTKILKKQNLIIEEKNKNITDSINYAKRLQNAILPSVEMIDKILPEYFILYQPKDIVSGDFYWVSHRESKIIVAAIDCTGHGVPGALLSIVGHNAINQTVNELEITKPSEILVSMNLIIKKILNQDNGTEIKDGMDMALCTYDKSTGILEYAGANNPLYIISEKKLSIIKASKLTVGSMQEEITNSPVNHSIQLKKGDCFYIFSDGYADQFGGAKNKKFKTSNLQKLLLSLNDYPMEIQKKMICEEFNKWKGNNEQVDDVLLIGIRV